MNNISRKSPTTKEPDPPREMHTHEEQEMRNQTHRERCGEHTEKLSRQTETADELSLATRHS